MTEPDPHLLPDGSTSWGPDAEPGSVVTLVLRIEGDDLSNIRDMAHEARRKTAEVAGVRAAYLLHWTVEEDDGP